MIHLAQRPTDFKPNNDDSWQRLGDVTRTVLANVIAARKDVSLPMARTIADHLLTPDRERAA